MALSRRPIITSARVDPPGSPAIFRRLRETGRSATSGGPCGGTGRRARLKIEFRKECWFDSGQGHQRSRRPDGHLRDKRALQGRRPVAAPDYSSGQASQLPIKSLVLTRLPSRRAYAARTHIRRRRIERGLEMNAPAPSFPTRFPLPTKISKTTPCKVTGVAGMDAYPRKHFDTSGKSRAPLHHRAICKTAMPKALRHSSMPFNRTCPRISSSAGWDMLRYARFTMFE